MFLPLLCPEETSDSLDESIFALSRLRSLGRFFLSQLRPEDTCGMSTSSSALESSNGRSTRPGGPAPSESEELSKDLFLQ